MLEYLFCLTFSPGGGIGFSGDTTCPSGFECVVQNPYYSQCVPSSGDDVKAVSATPTDDPCDGDEPATSPVVASMTSQAGATSVDAQATSTPSESGDCDDSGDDT